MPLDPATIRATAQRVVDEWKSRVLIPQHWDGWSDFGSDDQSRFIALVQAGADLAAQPDLNAVKREAASKAWDAACVYWRAEQNGTTPRAARDRYLAREYPETRECVLSDGRVVEWTRWDMRNGLPVDELTLDIVTNKDKPGRESRRCFKSLDDLRAKATLTWADWQLIDKAFAEAVR